MIGAAFAAAVAGLLVWLALSPAPRELVYEGRPLSAWLIDLQNPGNREAYAAATNVLNEVGTNTFPTLLHMIRAHDSRLTRGLFTLIDMQHLFKISHISSSRQNGAAVMGFNLLGYRAAPAVPELVRMYDRKSSPLVIRGNIALCLSYIGPDATAAVPSLLRETRNADDNLRGAAYQALASIHADPEAVAPVFIKGFQDPSFFVRFEAAYGLRNFGPDAKSAVPALIDCIKKVNPATPQTLPSGVTQLPASDVRKTAIAALQKIDPDAAARLAAELKESW